MILSSDHITDTTPSKKDCRKLKLLFSINSQCISNTTCAENQTMPLD